PGPGRWTARAHFRRSLLYALVALPFFRISRPSADGRTPHPRLDFALRRLGAWRAGALAPRRWRDASSRRLHRLAPVRFGGKSRARRAHVDRHAARLNRGGVRRSRCSAGRILDAWAERPGRALAHGSEALADRAGFGAWPGAPIEIHRRLLGRRRRPRPDRDALATPGADLACAVCGPC